MEDHPDPIPGTDGRYLSFAEVYVSDTSEEHCPSAKKPKQRTLPFHGKLQHVKNANLMIECEECGLWRLVYAIRKLSQRTPLDRALTGMSFSCGTPLKDMDMAPELHDLVYVQTLYCLDPIEILYYLCRTNTHIWPKGRINLSPGVCRQTFHPCFFSWLKTCVCACAIIGADSDVCDPFPSHGFDIASRSEVL
jgi:hypothetical protein